MTQKELQAHSDAVYAEFDEIFDMYRHRFGVQTYQRILIRRYSPKTIRKFIVMMKAFEERWKNDPKYYMCIIGQTAHTVVGIVMRGSGHIEAVVDQAGNICSQSKIGLAEDRIMLGSELIGNLANIDPRDSSAYKNNPPSETLRSELNNYVAMTHQAGDLVVHVESNTRWMAEQLCAQAEKYDGISVEAERTFVDPTDWPAVATIPLGWMVVQHKSMPLPYRADRVDAETQHDPEKLRAGETRYEHCGANKYAVAYVGEPWSIALFRRYKTMYSKSVKQIASFEDGAIYSFPAAWLRLSPPGQYSAKALKNFIN